VDARARAGVPSVFPSDLAAYPARSSEKALASGAAWLLVAAQLPSEIRMSANLPP
jgi:hypothetical protein